MNTYLSINMDAAGGVDTKEIKISSDDTTPGYLEGKITAGSTKLTITTTSPAGDERLQIDVDDTKVDHDQTLNYDVAQHRVINDVGTSTTELYSADKIISELALKIDLTEKAANNGVATLDAGGKIPSSQLPSSIMDYKGNHNVSTNSPTLIDGTGDTGDVYKVSVGGTRDYGSGSQTFVAGDWLVYNGTIWELSVNSDAVNSVNSQQGVVVLDADDISDAATTNKFTTAGDISKLAGIESGATADQSDSEIKTAYENNADTNAFTDAEQTKLANLGSTGDLNEGTYAGVADIVSGGTVTGFAFANGTVRSFDALVSVTVDATVDLYEEFNVSGVQKGADWEISYSSVGDDSLVTFDINTSGQILYSKTTTSGWVSTTINFRAIVTGV